jgi:predicted ABC-type ATPase
LNAVAAGRQATRLIADSLAARADLLVETTLSGKNALRLMDAAKARGYNVRLLYVGTDDVAINIARIAGRVMAGGHDVPAKDVIRRYGRSSENLTTAMARADEVAIFDNSSEGGPAVVARGVRCDLEYVVPEPRWLSDAINSSSDR